MAVSVLHERLRNVVPDPYSCDLNCTSETPTAEHTSTVTKQHRFKQLPGDYILKWMTGSSLWRNTVSNNTSSPPRAAERAQNGGFFFFFTADRQLLAQGAQNPASKDRTKVPPLSHLREQNEGFCTDPTYVFIPMCLERASPQLNPSVCTGGISVEVRWLSSPNGPTIPINPPGFSLFSASANILLWREMS